MIKIVKLKKFNIDFDYNKEIPFFQSNSEKRIRFDIDKLNKDTLKNIISQLYADNEIEILFVSEYIEKGKRISSKSKIGKIIKITNWLELVSFDKETNEGAIYANIKRLKQKDVYNYCLSVKRGFNEAYIVFFNDVFLMYVSSDVIDIISNENNISNLKKEYYELFDRFYEQKE